jgi:hypothetical protein
MPTDSSQEENSQVQRLHQMEMSIEALNARIARLAIGLGVSLNRDDELARVMSQHTVAHKAPERRDTANRRESTRTESDADRRMTHKWDELRGLLVLRYGIESRFVDQVGVAATHQIMAEAEAHLERNGFKPGADGIDLDRLFFKA